MMVKNSSGEGAKIPKAGCAIFDAVSSHILIVKLCFLQIYLYSHIITSESHSKRLIKVHNLF
jgi:hypothetical protein